MYFQAGPLAAMLLPATEARVWTFESKSYYIHHTLLLLIPIYLSQTFGHPPIMKRKIDLRYHLIIAEYGTH